MTTNPQMGNKVVFPQLSYAVCGCCFRVHNSLGRFRNEKQYADALEQEFKKEGINYIREFALPKSFSGEMPKRNIVDFLVEDIIMLELKAKRLITKEDYFQTRRYLASGNKKLGIIINFRQKFISPRRVLV